MKVKIIAKDCVGHIPGCTCCNYDLNKEIFYAEKDWSIYIEIYGEKFPDGSCFLPLDEVEVVDE